MVLHQGWATAWDAQHFQRIAALGYRDPADYAFPPLFPLLTALLSKTAGCDAVAASIIVANFFSYLTPLVVGRLYGFKTALFLALFPTYVLYTTAPYAEGVALFFASAALLYAERRPALSSTFLALAVLVKYQMALALPAFVKTWRLRHYLPPAAAVSAVALWHTAALGSPLAYFEIQRQIWGAAPATPLQQAQWILEGWLTAQSWTLFGQRLEPWMWLARNWAIAAFFLAGAISLRGLHRRYALLQILPHLFTVGTPAISAPRFMLAAFPALSPYAQRVSPSLYIPVALALTAFVARWHFEAFFA